MRILITNDDGIAAPGIRALAEIAGQVAGPGGEVWTVAPVFEQSGVAHTTSYVRPMMISRLGERRYAIDGSPADCVIAGLHHVLRDSPPDMVLSGVNRGNNSAENVVYSGTVGAAMEAALQGLPAFALSQYFGPRTAGQNDPFEASRVHLPGLICRILERHKPRPRELYQTFYNINVPPVPASQVKGTQVVRQGLRPTTPFTVDPFEAPNGRTYLWIRGCDQQQPLAGDSDAGANLAGYISVTPMRADLTADDLLADLGPLK